MRSSSPAFPLIANRNQPAMLASPTILARQIAVVAIVSGANPILGWRTAGARDCRAPPAGTFARAG